MRDEQIENEEEIDCHEDDCDGKMFLLEEGFQLKKYKCWDCGKVINYVNENGSWCIWR